MTWPNLNAAGAAASLLLWIAATATDWINSVRFVSHISMLALVFTFVAAWRADVPDNEPQQQ